MHAAGCPLCERDGGTVIFAGPKFRVVRADEPGFPAFYRVVWRQHVREFTDLCASDRALCMEAVADVEEALREHLQPTKVNLAALGNAVPHLHWHVIARFDWDSHFPGSVWAAVQREPATGSLNAVEQLRPGLEKDIARRLASRPGNCTPP